MKHYITDSAIFYSSLSEIVGLFAEILINQSSDGRVSALKLKYDRDFILILSYELPNSSDEFEHSALRISKNDIVDSEYCLICRGTIEKVEIYGSPLSGENVAGIFISLDESRHLFIAGADMPFTIALDGEVRRGTPEFPFDQYRTIHRPSPPI